MVARRKVSEVNTFRHMGRTWYIEGVDLSGQTVTVQAWTHDRNGYNIRGAVWREYAFKGDKWDAIASTHEDDSPEKAAEEAHERRWREEHPGEDY